MEDKYSDELLNIQLGAEIIDGNKPDIKFFALTEDILRNKFHVLPTDSVEEARQKIMENVSKDEFLYDFFKKDSRIWEIKGFDTGYWTTPAKEERTLSWEEIEELGYPEDKMGKLRLPIKDTTVIQTFQQKLTVRFAKRNLSNVFSDKTFFDIYEGELIDFLARDNVYLMMLKNKFIVKEPKSKSQIMWDSEKLLVVPDVELHLGKLASKFDSTDSYDYKKSLYRYIRIIHEAEKVQEKFHAKEICMSIGNDFFNTDTEQNTTTAGTEQHNDTRFQQMITNGIAAHIWAIERMKSVCDKVNIIFEPGNHDYLTNYLLMEQIYYLYRDDEKVDVHFRVKDRRWANGIVWENNLIIFAHGKTPEGKALNDDKLAELKDNMFKEEAKGVDNITVLAGHLHSASENNYRKRHSSGVDVIRNGSPSGDGAWDSGNMYSSDKSHQVFLFDANTGLYSTFNLKVPKEELERGITMPTITDDTDYDRVIEKSIAAKSEDLVLEDLRKLRNKINKKIKQIEKDYEKKLNGIDDILSDTDITIEQKKELLTILGYDKELKPYLDQIGELQQSIASYERQLKMNKRA